MENADTAMKKWDIFNFSFHNFLRRKTRSALTVLGVIIGTAAVVIMISIGVGMNKGFEDQISQWSDLRQIEVYKNYGYNDDGSASDVIGAMNKDGLEAIRQIPHIAASTPKLSAYAPLVMGKKQASINIIGIDPAEMAKFSYTVGTGRLLNAEDVGQGTFVMTYPVPFLISSPKKPVYWYDPYFGEPHPFDPLEQAFKLTMDYSYGQGPQDFSKPKPKLYKMECVGILQQKPEGSYDDPVIYMDIDLLIKYRDEYNKANGGGSSGGIITYGVGGIIGGDFGGGSSSEDIYDQFIVLVDETKNVQDVEKQIRALGYNTYSSMSSLTEMQEQSKFLRTVLGAIGIIAFFVAALSITNTMIMSIYERTREIGVMKVLGCRVRDVRSMFLVEAGIIGLVGGILGVGLSYGASALLNHLGKDSGGILGYSTGGTDVSIVPPWLALVALALACFVGIASGLYPAIRATRLPALEAMKNE